MARHLKLRTLSALIATFVTLAMPAWAMTPSQVLAQDGTTPPQALSAWIAVPIGFALFFLAIYGASRLVHNNRASDRQFGSESGDRPVTPVPSDDGHHHFH